MTLDNKIIYKYHFGIIDAISIIALLVFAYLLNMKHDSSITGWLTLVLAFSAPFITIFTSQLGTIEVGEDGIKFKHKLIKLLNWTIYWKDIEHAWWHKNYITTELLFDLHDGPEKKILLKRWRIAGEPMHTDITTYSLFRQINQHIPIEELTRGSAKARRKKLHTQYAQQDIGKFAGQVTYTLLVLIVILLLTGIYPFSYRALGDGVPNIPVFVVSGMITLVIGWHLVKRGTMFAAVPIISLLAGIVAAVAIFQIVYISVIWFGHDVKLEYVLSDANNKKQTWRSSYQDYPKLDYYPGIHKRFIHKEKGDTVNLVFREGWYGVMLLSQNESKKIITN